MVQQIIFFVPILRPVFGGFWAPLWGPKPPQNEPTWHPKAMGRSHDGEKKRFWKLLFCIVFYSKSGTPGLPREPQDSQETSQVASKWPWGGCPKNGPILESDFNPKSNPKVTSIWAPKRLQKWSKNGTCICRTKMEVKTESAVRCACTCTCKSCLRNKRKGYLGCPFSRCWIGF